MTETNFIRANDKYAEKADKKLQKLGLSTNIETFINQYNNKIISPRNPSVLEIVEALTKGYSNIATRDSRIFVKSQTETIIAQAQFLLKHYELLAVLKRIATDMREEDFEDNTKLIITSSRPGVIFLEPDVEDIEVSDVNTEETSENYYSESGLPSIEEASGQENSDTQDTSFRLDKLVAYDGAENFTGRKTAVADNPFLHAFIHDYNVQDDTAFFYLHDLADLKLEGVDYLGEFVETAKP